MLARVDRVRRRRQVVTAGLATLALVVSGSVVALEVARGASEGTAGLESAGYTTHSLELMNTIFTDHDHGYVLQRRCTYTTTFRGAGGPSASPSASWEGPGRAASTPPPLPSDPPRRFRPAAPTWDPSAQPTWDPSAQPTWDPS